MTSPVAEKAKARRVEIEATTSDATPVETGAATIETVAS